MTMEIPRSVVALVRNDMEFENAACCTGSPVYFFTIHYSFFTIH